MIRGGGKPKLLTGRPAGLGLPAGQSMPLAFRQTQYREHQNHCVMLKSEASGTAHLIFTIYMYSYYVPAAFRVHWLQEKLIVFGAGAGVQLTEVSRTT